MMLEQGQTAESQARYSAEEVREILRLAASLQENTFSVEQLRAIACEAGIADEPLERAIQHFVAAEISPSGKYVALHDAGTGEVWVVDAQGKVQLGTRIGTGSPHGSQNGAERSPTLKWRTRGSNEMLHIRLADEREITIAL